MVHACDRSGFLSLLASQPVAQLYGHSSFNRKKCARAFAARLKLSVLRKGVFSLLSTPGPSRKLKCCLTDLVLYLRDRPGEETRPALRHRSASGTGSQARVKVSCVERPRSIGVFRVRREVVHSNRRPRLARIGIRRQPSVSGADFVDMG